MKSGNRLRVRKRLMFVILTALIAATIAVVYEIPARLWARLGERRTAQTAFISSMRAHQARLVGNIEPGAVLFIGSSSIQGLDVGAVADRAVNLGIGSDTVTGVDERWPSAVVPTARAVVFAIGWNDLAAESAVVVGARMQAVMARVPAQIPILVSGLQPLVGAAAGELPDRHDEIEALNRLYRDLCEDRARCAYVDTDAALRDCPGPSAHEADGIHLSPDGYRCWKEALRQGLLDLGVSGVRSSPRVQ